MLKQSESRRSKYKNDQNSIKTYKQELDDEVDYIESKRSRLKFNGDFKLNEPSWIAEYQQ